MEDAWADVGPLNMTEEDVPKYSLPPLVATDLDQWEEERAHLLEAFREHAYGRVPETEVELHLAYEEASKSALGGKALRKQTRTEIRCEDRILLFDTLIYLPTDAPRPVPLFLGLNFCGNHTVDADPNIRLPQGWVPLDERLSAKDHVASQEDRGANASRWCVEQILERGYGIATVYCGDFDPDFHDGFANGVHGLIGPPESRTSDSWGAICAWAYGLSCARDMLELDDDVDASRIAVIGHSRLGKAALWAAVEDPDFAMVISNNSGCGGAALFRRCFGETVQAINARYPHWFAKNFHAFNGREAELPFDQHQLLALVAPRPLYVASASLDSWADARGEFLATQEASAAWRLYEREGLTLEQFPDPGKGSGASTVGYHLREGDHDICSQDWARYLDFADQHL